MPLSARPPFSCFSAVTWQSASRPVRRLTSPTSLLSTTTPRRAALCFTRNVHTTSGFAQDGSRRSNAAMPDQSGATAAAALASQKSSLRQRALEVGLITAPDERVHAPLRSSARSGNTLGTARAAAQASQHSCVVDETGTAPEEAPVPQDPLLEFLEKNEEDAAVLLAMWTSLTRACLHASEVSESLTLRVRYVFHRLIHQRAIAAAWELYERLVYLGVQLRHSDIVLLVTNLPYEHSANNPTEPHKWMNEDSAALKERQTRSRRQREIAEESARWRNRNSGASGHTGVPVPAPNNGADHEGSCEPRVEALADSGGESTVDSAVAPSSSVPNAASAATAVEVHVLANQPEWVKRWLLYEASMGNFNLYEGIESQSQNSHSATHGLPRDAALADSNNVVDILPEQDSDTANPEADSQQAVRMLELVAHIEHLRILQLAPPDVRRTYRVLLRQAGVPTRWRIRKDRTPSVGVATVDGARRRPSLHKPTITSHGDASAAATSFWREALECTRQFYAAEKLSSIPTELRQGLRRIVLGSRSWPAAMAYCQLLASFAIPLDPVDAGLFIHLSADSSPWKSSTVVEAFVQDSVLPCLCPSSSGTASSSSAVRSAATAFWLSHLCAVKSTRPEDFVVLLDHTRHRLAVPDPGALAQGEMRHLVTAVAHAALASVRCYDREWRAYHQRRRAEKALAASIRSGLFAARGETDQHSVTVREGEGTADASGLQRQLQYREDLHATTGVEASVLGTEPDESDAVLSSDLVATFRTLCMSTQEALWIVALAATPRHRGSVEALHDLLDRCVYGPRSLWAVYERLYIPPSDARGAVEAARAAPERTYMSCVTARFTLHVLTVVCRQYSKTRSGMGAQHTVAITSPVQVALLLDMSEKALRQAASRSTTGDVHLTWASPLREEIAAVCQLWPRVLRQLFAYLGLSSTIAASASLASRQDERVLFGAVTPAAIECIAKAGRLTLFINDLTRHALPSARTAPLAAEHVEEEALGTLRHAMFFRTRKTLRACFDKQTTLGKKVRQQMNRRELQQMDALLFPARRRAAVKWAFHYYTSPVHQLDSTRSSDGSAVTGKTTLDPPLHSTRGAAFIPAQMDSGSMSSLLNVREQAHTLLLRYANDQAQLNQALTSLVAKSDWARALQLVHILTDDLRVAPRTLSTPFFKCVMAAMARTVPDAPASASPQLLRTTAGRGAGQNLRQRRQSGHPSSPGACGVRDSLWLDAIGVFWKAVDHTHRPDRRQAHATGAAAAHEREVFDNLLVPLIEFGLATGRRDLAREWYEAWARQYTRYEKHDPHFRHCSAEALSLLGDAAALAQSAKLITEDTHANAESACQRYGEGSVLEDHARGPHDEVRDAALTHYGDALTSAQALLCRVAPRQRQWLKALETLTTAFGTIDAREGAKLPYPSEVVAALLSVLAKSPTNLSNTGLRLRQLQRTAHAEVPLKDTWSADCAIGLCELLVRARRWRRASDLVTEALELPAMMAVKENQKEDDNDCGLPAEATRQYAALLTLGLQAAAIGGVSDKATVLYDDFQALEARLGTHSADTDVDASAAAQRYVAELSPRARSYFFRAVTKKMFPTSGDDVDRSSS